jgi:hypothetical protein
VLLELQPFLCNLEPGEEAHSNAMTTARTYQVRDTFGRMIGLQLPFENHAAQASRAPGAAGGMATVRAAILALSLAALSSAQTITMTSPAASQAVTGTALQLAVAISALPSLYSVEYDVNGEVACISTAAPWSCSWNTFYFFGGAAAVTAIARDALNATIATSPPVNFSVQNDAPEPAWGTSTWSLATSTPLTSNWSGTVTLTATFSGSSLCGGTFYIDGQQLGTVNSNTPTYSLDTQAYDNGVHTLVGICVDGHLSGGWTQVGQWEQQVNFSNSAAEMEMRLSATEIFLCTTTQPLCPTSYTLTAKLYNTDQTSAVASSLTFLSSDTTIATVNSSGVVTQVGIGNAHITVISGIESGANLHINSGGFVSSATHSFLAHDVGNFLSISGGTGCTTGLYRVVGYGASNGFATLSSNPGTVGSNCTWVSGPSAQAWVYVNTQNVLPHFGTDGSILTAFDPVKSIYYCSMFFSDQPFTDSDYPRAFNYGSDYASSGCNTIETAIWTAPTPYNGQTQAQWQSIMSSYVAGKVALVQPNNLFLHLIGDGGMLRANGDAYTTTHSPAALIWSPPAAQYAFSAWVNNRVIGADMVDEVQTLYGDVPLECISTNGCFIGQNGFTQIACVSGGTCTVSWTGWSLRSNTGSSHFFIITGSGNSNLDYNASSGCAPPYTATTIDGNSFTFPTPAGVGTATFTSGSNPSLQIEPYVYAAVDATGHEGPNEGSSAGPCVDYPRYDMFNWFMNTINNVTGRLKITWPISGGFSARSAQNWLGDPRMADFADVYFAPATSFLPQRFATYSILSSIGGAYRAKYGFLGNGGGSGNRLSPILVESEGVSTDYGFQGYQVPITNMNNGTINFGAPHQLLNIIPWSTRLWITGASTINGNFYVRDCPSPTSCNVASEYPSFGTTINPTATVTFQDGSTFPVNFLRSSTSDVKNSLFAITGDPSCSHKSKQGQTMTFSGANLGNFDASVSTWYYPGGQLNSGCGTVMAAVSLGSSTGGTATIIANNGYVRGVNHPGPSGSETGARYEFAASMYCAVLGCAGNRIYQIAQTSLDDPSGPSGVTFNFQDTGNQTYQAGLHPHYQYGPSQLAWQANVLPVKMAARQIKYLFQPRTPSPDYGGFLECTARQGTFGNFIGCQSFSDAVLTRTMDLSACAVPGQATIKYSAGWRGIAITKIAAGVTSDTAVYDPDSASYISYICSSSANAEYSPPLISVRLADVPTAAKIVIQYSYTPGLFGNPQVSSQALPLVFDCTTGATCVLPVDRNIGAVFYRVIYMDANRKVLATSDVQQL